MNLNGFPPFFGLLKRLTEGKKTAAPEPLYKYGATSRSTSPFNAEGHAGNFQLSLVNP